MLRSMKITSISYLGGMSAVIALSLGTTGFAQGPRQKVAEKQQEEERVFLEKLSKDYKGLDDLWKARKADSVQPAGVTFAVMEAIQKGYFYAGMGQNIQVIKGVFGHDALIKAPGTDRRLLIRLEFNDDGSKLPNSQSAQWHLVVGLDKNSKITTLRIQHTSMKMLYMEVHHVD